jgi:hypothetical protein
MRAAHRPNQAVFEVEATCANCSDSLDVSNVRFDSYGVVVDVEPCDKCIKEEAEDLAETAD